VGSTSELLEEQSSIYNYASKNRSCPLAAEVGSLSQGVEVGRSMKKEGGTNEPQLEELFSPRRKKRRKKLHEMPKGVTTSLSRKSYNCRGVRIAPAHIGEG